MKLVTIKFPFGKTVRVSHQSANLAIAFERIAQYPGIMHHLQTALDSINQTAAVFDAIEKTSGAFALKELIEKTYPIGKSK